MHVDRQQHSSAFLGEYVSVTSRSSRAQRHRRVKFCGGRSPSASIKSDPLPYMPMLMMESTCSRAQSPSRHRGELTHHSEHFGSTTTD